MFKNFSYLIVAASLIIFASACSAADINLHVDFAYNGPSANTTGFKLYQRDPAGNTKVIAEIANPEARTYDGVISVTKGRSYYYLTAYNATEESGPSNEYPFEYIEPVTGGLPTPTVIIKFN